LQRQYAEIRGAVEQFYLLANEAAGFLGNLPSVYLGVDSPRKPERSHRWLEAVCASVQVEPAGYHSFDVRRVPGNVFQASAIHLERLQTETSHEARIADASEKSTVMPETTMLATFLERASEAWEQGNSIVVEKLNALLAEKAPGVRIDSAAPPPGV